MFQKLNIIAGSLLFVALFCHTAGAQTTFPPAPPEPEPIPPATQATPPPHISLPNPAPPPEDAASINRKINRALASLSHEPTLEELQSAALRLADADVSATSRWKRAARLQAVLPTLKLSADYGAGRDETLDRYQEKPDRWGADTDRGYDFQVSAQWKLDELIFNADELKVYDALADRAARREGLLTLLVGYYFERRRLQLVALLEPPPNLMERLEIRMRIAEVTASIDALTGGLLSHRLTRGNTAH
jgi:hypothetical protein